jgi:ubiquinone/menaquinone biosynthesis C-methylase UbiE
VYRVYRSQTVSFDYDSIPPGYYFEVLEKGSPIQRFWHREKFEYIAKFIQPGERVLDFGCGPGALLYVVSQSNPTVKGVGIDLAQPQIDFANQQVRPRLPGRDVSYLAVSLDQPNLPFEDESFDVVTIAEVIEHVHPFDSLKSMLELRRVLKPGGRIIVTTPNYRSLWPLIELLLEWLSPVKYREQHISKYTPSSLVRFVETCGFEVTKAKTFFLFAPFLTPISERLGKFVHRLETSIDLKLGSLTLVCGKKLP